jgi:hypothetical protein
MTNRRIAAILLAAGAVFFVSQADDLAAQTPPPKKFGKKRDEKPAEPEVKPAVKAAPSETQPPKPMDATAVAKFIDVEINRQLAAENVPASPRSSDAEFIRRASLDITGVVPSAERVESFLASGDANKRAQLIDELLSSPKYGQRLADVWSGPMLPPDSATRGTSKEPMVKWLVETFNANKPWDRMAHDILTAAGEQDKNGAVTYYMFNQGVDKMTDSVGKLFLGVQIQCAQCHNHPFTHWKQTEYWGLAQFFYNVNVSIVRNGKDTTTVPGVSESGRKGKNNRLPESAKSVAAKFLGAETVSLSSGKPYRPVLADWICTAENPFFSKSMVNRVWAQYFARGLVNPIDDLSDENEPTHPALLTGLAKEFASGGFDIKNLVRAICLSDAYQRTSVPTPENKADTVFYSHMAVKVLTPEQLYDSIGAVAGGFGDRERPMGKGGPRGGPVTARDRFVAFFQGSESPKATDYEAGIPQALRLMNNPQLSSSAKVLREIGKDQPAKAIERLYLMTMSRKPTGDEVKRLTNYIAQAGSTQTAYSDIAWVLLNSSEFALNH